MTNLCNIVSGHVPMNEIIKTELSPLIAGTEYRNSEECLISTDVYLDLVVSCFNGLDSNSLSVSTSLAIIILKVKIYLNLLTNKTCK